MEINVDIYNCFIILRDSKFSYLKSQKYSAEMTPPPAEVEVESVLSKTLADI